MVFHSLGAAAAKARSPRVGNVPGMCCSNMFPRVNRCFLLVQLQFGGIFCPPTYCTKVNLLMGHVAGPKRCKDAIKLRAYGYTTCPCYRIRSWTSQRQRPEFFELVYRENQDGSDQRERCPCCCFWQERFGSKEKTACYFDDANKGFHCLFSILSIRCLSNRIGLSLKWAISIRLWLLFQEILTALFRTLS